MIPLWLWSSGALVCGGCAFAVLLDRRACRCLRHRCLYCRREAWIAATFAALAVLCGLAPVVLAGGCAR